MEAAQARQPTRRRKIVRWVLNAVYVTFLGFWAYGFWDGVLGPKRRMAQRERKFVAEVRAFLRQDERFRGVEFARETSDHSNVLQLTGKVASASAFIELKSFVDLQRTNHRVAVHLDKALRQD
jgi:hypothetical protein